jgi:thiol-disulfide isomerase/thioredoxin
MTQKSIPLGNRWASRLSMLFLWAAVAACAPPSLLEQHPDSVLVTRAQVAQYEHAVTRSAELDRRVERLEDELAAIQDRLGRVEPRVGLQAKAPSILKPMPGGATVVKLPDAQRVNEVGARGKRSSVKRFVEGKRGVVVAFWATWCVPCTSAEELRHMTELREQLHGHGAEFVSMPIDGLDKVMGDRRAPTWLYPLFQKDGGHLEILPRSFVSSVGVNLPLFLVIDRSGRVTHYHNTVLSSEVIREMVTHTAFRG